MRGVVTTLQDAPAAEASGQRLLLACLQLLTAFAQDPASTESFCSPGTLCTLCMTLLTISSAVGSAP